MSFFSKIETKVVAATAGGGLAGAASTAVLWALGVYAWDAPRDASHNDVAIASVPPAIAVLIPLVMSALGALIFGYNAAPSNHAGNDLTALEPSYTETAATEAQVGDAGGAVSDIPEPDTDDINASAGPATFGSHVAGHDIV